MLNAGYKILDTTLANRLSSIVEFCVHNEQMGFIHGGYLNNNIRRLMNIISKAQLDNVPGVLLFLDAEKAYNCIEWPYLYIVAGRFGLGHFFQTWLRLLYKNQTAIISIEGVNLEKVWGAARLPIVSFVICSGTRASGNSNS